MKKMLMYGSGNIGRGFIGLTFAQAGYSVAFVDINKEVIDALNGAKKYPVDIVSTEEKKRVWAENVCGLYGGDVDAIAREIATCDIMATAVGVNVLKFIAPVLLAGIRKRWQIGNKNPLNIIICENLIGADAFLRDLITAQMDEDEKKRLDAEVGLVMASIGRMVPVMTEEQKKEYPMLVCVEPYNTLPIDKDAFKGDDVPSIQNLMLVSPFEYVVEKKLFVHNLGHAVCAYLGMHCGYTYTYESMMDPWVYLCVQNAMLESAGALSNKYAYAGVEMNSIVHHINDLTYRFQNKALGDTNERVGADPARKLSYNDRLVGAATLAVSQGSVPVFTGVGIAAGILRLEKESGKPVDVSTLLAFAQGSNEGRALLAFINQAVDLMKRNTSAKDIFKAAELVRVKKLM